MSLFGHKPEAQAREGMSLADEIVPLMDGGIGNWPVFAPNSARIRVEQRRFGAETGRFTVLRFMSETISGASGYSPGHPVTMIDTLETIGHLSHFAFRAVLALPGALLRLRLWLAQLYPILLGSLPLGVTAGIAIGAVVWMHLRGALQMVGGPGA